MHSRPCFSPSLKDVGWNSIELKKDLKCIDFGQITPYTIPCITNDTIGGGINDGERAESNISIGNINAPSDLAASSVMKSDVRVSECETLFVSIRVLGTKQIKSIITNFILYCAMGHNVTQSAK